MNTVTNPIQNAYKNHIAGKAELISLAKERVLTIRKEIHSLHNEESCLENMLETITL
jgi:hypothetical protein